MSKPDDHTQAAAAAATKIQSLVRGHKARSDIKEAAAAATKILSQEASAAIEALKPAPNDRHNKWPDSTERLPMNKVQLEYIIQRINHDENKANLIKIFKPMIIILKNHDELFYTLVNTSWATLFQNQSHLFDRISEPENRISKPENNDMYMNEYDRQNLLAMIADFDKYIEEALVNNDDHETLNNDNSCSQDSRQATIDLLIAVQLYVSTRLKADINIQDNERKTHLVRAVERKELSFVNELLATTGIDVNIQDSNGKTALMYAVEAQSQKQDVKDSEVIIALLDQPGIDVNIQDNEGRTALMIAVANQNHEIVDLLINSTNANANLTLQDGSGQTALMKAMQVPDDDERELILDLLNMKAQESDNLVEFQSKKDGNGTALDIASVPENQELIDILQNNMSEVKNSNPVNIQKTGPNQTNVAKSSEEGNRVDPTGVGCLPCFRNPLASFFSIIRRKNTSLETKEPENINTGIQAVKTLSTRGESSPYSDSHECL